MVLWTSQKLCSYFADFEQVNWLFCWLWTSQKLNWQQNSRGRNWMLMHFFFFFFWPSPHVTGTPPWLLRPVRVSTSFELYLDIWLFLFFECLDIQFFNSLTCGLRDTMPRQEPPNSYLGKQRISLRVRGILSMCLRSHT